MGYLALSSFFDLREVARSMAMIDPLTAAAVLALSLATYVLRFGRWALYLRDPAHRVPLGRHLGIYVAGFALTPTPSKVGEAVRALYLKPFGIGYGRCLAAVYTERLLDVVAVCVLSALILLAPGTNVRWIGLVGAGVALALISLQHPLAVAFVERLVGRLPWRRLRKAGAAVAAFLVDVRSMMGPRLALMGFGVGVLAWGAEGVGLYLIAQALGIDIGLWIAIGISATAMLAGALSFLPGGLGSTEVVMISLLVSFGASAPAAVAATILFRLATLWFAVAIGAGAWVGIEMFRGAPAVASGGDGREASAEGVSPGGTPPRPRGPS